MMEKFRCKVRVALIATLFLSTLFSTSLLAKGKRSVAIVVDSEVIVKNQKSLELYMTSIERDGITPILIEERWGVPDSLRAYLYKLFNENNLEGAILIGNIPIAMVRNGQHLTTAFKMDQGRDWKDSSVPSDRFYDDFSLQFDFLNRDSTEALYFYYNLSPNGAQKVSSDIYSSRIKPPHYPGVDRFALLDRYFEKLVKERERGTLIKNILNFGGHGYNSDCMVARADERVSLLKQFPYVGSGKGNLTYIDHTYDNSVKRRLLGMLSEEKLDLAILHHHGSDDTQYLNGTPRETMADKWIEMTKKFFRGKIRRAKDTTASKNYYIENYNVPEEWVSNAFDPAVMRSDSLLDAASDIHIADLAEVKPTPRFIMLDACFNGSFHLDHYTAGHYIFNPGRTVVVKANSVNTLQDVWTNQLIGLLELGVSVGNWAKEQFTLESHLFGDATYSFTPSVAGFEKLDRALSGGEGAKISYWKKLAKSDNVEAQAIAIRRLYEMGELSPAQLLSIQKSSEEPTVRLMAFALITEGDSPSVVPSIIAGLQDNFEMLKRLASTTALKNQSPELLPYLVELVFDPGLSKRVEFQGGRAFESLPKEMVLEAFDKQLAKGDSEWYEMMAKRRDRLENVLNRRDSEFEALLEFSDAGRGDRMTISALRNSNSVAQLNLLFQFMRESPNDQLRMQLAEAFGWYTKSYKREEIVQFCLEQIEVEKSEDVKKELLRTVRRLAR